MVTTFTSPFILAETPIPAPTFRDLMRLRPSADPEVTVARNVEYFARTLAGATLSVDDPWALPLRQLSELAETVVHSLDRDDDIPAELLQFRFSVDELFPPLTGAIYQFDAMRFERIGGIGHPFRQIGLGRIVHAMVEPVYLMGEYELEPRYTNYWTPRITDATLELLDGDALVRALPTTVFPKLLPGDPEFTTGSGICPDGTHRHDCQGSSESLGTFPDSGGV